MEIEFVNRWWPSKDYEGTIPRTQKLFRVLFYTGLIGLPVIALVFRKAGWLDDTMRTVYMWLKVALFAAIFIIVLADTIAVLSKEKKLNTANLLLLFCAAALIVLELI